MNIVRNVADLRARISAWRKEGETVGLVPTMGALHDGHVSLVRQSMAANARTIVTLFVNPTQFGPNEDFDAYPRGEDRDRAILEAEGTDLLFAPGVTEMYPPGALTRVQVPELGDILEGAHRPGFFTGVATIVTKLLLQSLPDRAYFGEKDYQQLQVIRRLAKDLDIPVSIEGAPTVREEDGLALSSRNAYLSPEERRIAPALYQAIAKAANEAANGGDIAKLEAVAIAEIIEAGFDSVDYVAIRNADMLNEAYSGAPGRVLTAAKLGRTRLIDNLAVPPAG